MTIAEAISFLRGELKDTSSDTARQRRIDSVFANKLNIAQKLFCRFTKALRGESTLTLTEDDDEADVPSDFICFDPEDVVGEEGGIILNNVSMDYRTTGWLDKHESGWRGADSATPNNWHLKDLATIRFNCPLSATAAAYTAIIRYIRGVTALSTDDTSAELLEGIDALVDYHYTILYWVLARCKGEDGDGTGHDKFFAMWKSGLEEAKGDLKMEKAMRGALQMDPRYTAQIPRPPE